jgi:methylmalonyl-CoA mutase cobalamin-binding domain/chain
MAERQSSSNYAAPIRILTAVPVCDGHDSAITTINLELSRAGIEVVYLGYNRSARDVVRAAVQEDVAAVGISSYNGGHAEFFREVVKGLQKDGASHIGVFGGGGGTISPADARTMRRHGVDRIFFPGESLSEIVEFVRGRYARYLSKRAAQNGDLALAMRLTVAERRGKAAGNISKTASRVIGITGLGGAGKTTLIDELVFRALKKNRNARIGILSHDPSIVGNGALLGDRAAMIYAQDDRVFMRSLGTRGQAGGVARGTPACLAEMRRSRFDLLFVETVGIGQEALPFPAGAVDHRVLVMSSDYGARLQLQKIAMLDVADIVVLNKADLSAAPAARAEIAARLESGRKAQRLICATAKRHNDPSVDELFEAIA